MFGIGLLKDQVLELTSWIIELRREINELRCRMLACPYNPKCPEEAQGKSCLTKEDFYFKIHEVIEKLTELHEFFHSEDEYNCFNRIQDKLNQLIDDEKQTERIELARKTLDKFDDYMKNVDKLNVMVNEIKGVSAMVRANLNENKYISQEYFDYKMGDIIGRLDNRNEYVFTHLAQLYDKMNQVLNKTVDMESQIKRLAKPRPAIKKITKNKQALPTANKKKFTPAEV